MSGSIINVSIDGRPVAVAEGATVLDAARELGIDVPTMCYLKDAKPFTSCMVCLVEDTASQKLLPACSSLAQDGMTIRTDTAQVHEARQRALELLLSEHVGDCEGPCRCACPVHLDIPRLLRAVGRADWRSARSIVDDAQPPCVGEQDCKAPCERVCRRNQVDAAVSNSHYGSISSRSVIPSLPRDLLIIENTGDLLRQAQHRLSTSLEMTDQTRHECLQNENCCAAVSIRAVVRCVAGLDVEATAGPSVEAFVRNVSVIGKLMAEEHPVMMRDVSAASRVVAVDPDGGYAADEATREAARCMHCDCRKGHDCALRDYAIAYEADQRHYAGGGRRPFEQITQHADILYEPGKCIRCGICVRITEREREPLGLTFIGRGFDVRIGVPFEGSLAEGLREVARDCAEACPTGALCVRKEAQQ